MTSTSRRTSEEVGTRRYLAEKCDRAIPQSHSPRLTTCCSNTGSGSRSTSNTNCGCSRSASPEAGRATTHANRKPAIAAVMGFRMTQACRVRADAAIVRADCRLSSGSRRQRDLGSLPTPSGPNVLSRAVPAPGHVGLLPVDDRACEPASGASAVRAASARRSSKVHDGFRELPVPGDRCKRIAFHE